MASRKVRITKNTFKFVSAGSKRKSASSTTKRTASARPRRRK